MRREHSLAASDFTEAVRLAPDRAPAYKNRGLAHLALGDAAAALDDLNAAIRLDPTHADAYHHRGNAYRLLNDEERAVTDYIEAIRRNPKAADVFESFSRVWGGGGSAPHGERQFAIELARSACVLSGWEDWHSLRRLASAHAEAGEFTDALVWIEQAIALAPEAARLSCRDERDRYSDAASPAAS